MLRNIAISATLAILCNSKSTSHAYCLGQPITEQVGQSWLVKRKLPVYIYGSANAPTWNGMNNQEVASIVTNIVNTWWEESGADVRPYIGTGTYTQSTSTTGRILFRTTTNCQTCEAEDYNPTACVTFTSSGTERIGATIWFEDSACIDPGLGPWTTDLTGEFSDFRAVALHEVGHALGLKHPHDGSSCTHGGATDPDMENPVMGPTRQYVIRQDDHEGLVAHFGHKFRKLEYRTSPQMLVWSSATITNRTDNVRPQSGGFAMTGSVNVGVRNQFAAARGRVAIPGSSMTYSTPAGGAPSFPEHFTFRPIALARGGTNSDWLVAWTSLDDDGLATTIGGTCYIATTRNDGSTWTIREQSEAGFNIRSKHTPTATFTGAHYVVFWNGVRHMAYDLEGNKTSENTAGDTELDAIHTPAAACGTVSSWPCILVYDHRDPHGCFSWAHFQYSTIDGNLTIATPSTFCYRQETTPAVVWREDDLIRNWGVVYKQKESLYSIRAGNFDTAWHDQTLIASDSTNGLYSAALRSYKQFQNGWVYSYYLFTGRTP